MEKQKNYSGIKVHFLYISTIVALAVLLLLPLNKEKKYEEVVENTTDTCYIIKVDTIIEYKIKYVYKKTIDTLYLEKEDSSLIKLPIVQKLFQNDGVWDIWASGIEPLNVDSVKFYRNTEYITVTNQVDRIVYKNKWNVYGFVGLNSIYGTFYPKVGIVLTEPKKWLISAEIGMCNNDVFYGMNIGYKFND